MSIFYNQILFFRKDHFHWCLVFIQLKKKPAIFCDFLSIFLLDVESLFNKFSFLIPLSFLCSLSSFLTDASPILLFVFFLLFLLLFFFFSLFFLIVFMQYILMMISPPSIHPSFYTYSLCLFFLFYFNT